MTGPEQINLAAIVESMAQVNKHRRSIDEHGAQYLLFFRQYNLHPHPHLHRSNSSTSASAGAGIGGSASASANSPAVLREMSWREITWAFHSDSQEILVDVVNRNAQGGGGGGGGGMLWNQARQSGIFMWLRDAEAVRRQFEAIARNHYTRTDEKNPIDCSLYYLALRKKNVLTGLWRMASWHREQPSTMKFLANNFSEQRWKTAAQKNAYALLGKHRFGFFPIPPPPVRG